ncbi:hypothetical protein WJX73_001677 [Symbiochloris irregularis]|uniref:Uncharacterized protein n=1 Tax=Symbiochloris irregularis TaxID=706552 RepID=A0AAW1NR20_9CHLO
MTFVALWVPLAGGLCSRQCNGCICSLISGRRLALQNKLRPSARAASLMQLTLQPRSMPAKPHKRASTGRQPDVSAEHKGRQLHVFGTAHLEHQADIACWILAKRPAAVVFETAVTPKHGMATGNVFDCVTGPQDPVQPLFVRWLCPLAQQIADSNGAALEDLAANFSAEQLAYIATLAIGAPLVFGDRSKRETFKRLLTIPTNVELDSAFGLQASLNALELLDGQPAIADPNHSTLNDCDLSNRNDLERPQQGASAAARQGIRRALVECVLRLSCGEGVLQEFQMYLPSLEPTEQEQYDAVTQLYGTPRMLLAVLSRQLLQRVCGGLGVDMWDVLQPLRQARPINGGSAVDPDLVMDLRLLNYQLD